jgi:hypothetical protein
MHGQKGLPTKLDLEKVKGGGGISEEFQASFDGIIND